MKLHPSLLGLPLLATLAACSSDSNYDFDASQDALDAQIIAASPPQALFNPDPAAPVLPFPNNLFFLGSLDGTLNIPLAEDDDQTLGNPRVALNQVDGFSTTAPIVTAVSETLKPESLVLGDTVRVFEVTTQAVLAVTSIIEELNDPLTMAVQEVGGQLVLVPRVPLKPKTDYLVVLTNGITDVDDMPLQASLVYGTLKGDTVLTNPSLEGLRQATASHLAALNGAAGIDPATVVLSWVFKTQSIRDVLQQVKDQTIASNLLLGDSAQTTAAVGLQGKADIFVGSLEVPYYQTAVGGDGNPVPALNSYWQNASANVVGAINESGTPDYAPVATGTETIPVIMTVPNTIALSGGTMPGDGWPVTVFQHGITGNRTQMLALADAMADAGRVLIAIDMPMHGLIDNTIPFHADNTPFDERERTFNIDATVNPLAEGVEADEDAPTTGPDGQTDTSGTHFYNLQNLANSRDNLRQAVADLFVLSASLNSAQVENVSLNVNNLTFVGHSLGSIVGTTMLSYDSSFQAATLAMPGSGVARLLSNSEQFGPVINGGLAAAGIETGSVAYESFLTAAQTLVDSGDPVNHATTLAQSGNTALHIIEVIGDTVIPNEVATAPLSGTEPLARLLNLQPTAASSATGGLVRFSAGDHGSIIRPTASLAATIEMQIQTATFAASLGASLPVTDTSVIQAVE